jgi:hypothetical protein
MKNDNENDPQAMVHMFALGIHYLVCEMGERWHTRHRQTDRHTHTHTHTQTHTYSTHRFSRGTINKLVYLKMLEIVTKAHIPGLTHRLNLTIATFGSDCFPHFL